MRSGKWKVESEKWKVGSEKPVLPKEHRGDVSEVEGWKVDDKERWA